MFQDSNGKPLKFFNAVIGGRSVGAPGTPALLWEMHQKWGVTPWRTLITPAMNLANEGFRVSPRLAALVDRSAESLAAHAPTAEYFLPEGNPVQPGYLLKNPQYAQSLHALFEADNVSPFYQGELAANIVSTVQEFTSNPGVLSRADLAAYRVKQRDPVCVDYRLHQVCGMGPPSSGALTVGQILGLLTPYDLKSMGPGDPQSWRLIGDASRLAFVDRARYMADSDFVPMPTKGLVSSSYLKTRSALLNTDKALPEVSPGEPEWDHARLYSDDNAIELPSTSHFSIVDKFGNAVSMTTTIENGFGSRLMVGGFLLNNELTDFSFRSHRDGVPVANRVEPGKRPRSSMSPTIILKDGKPAIVIGSPGGSRIIGYVAKTIIAHLDWGMDIQQAIASPHLVNRFGTFDLEADTTAAALAPKLEELGYQIKIRDLNSGLHGIVFTPDGLEGGADPRREGVVLAE